MLAEDTRNTGILLKHYNIANKLFAHHQHNEHNTVEMLSERICNGESMALVTDAGTPGISDPGFLLVRQCIQKGIVVECLPGPTAFVPALVASGLPCDSFVFEGFLPVKKGRQTQLQKLSDEERTIVLYESPHRLVKTLQQLAEYFGAERKAAVAREISKMHEEVRRGSLQELALHYEQAGAKGEIVLVIAGKEK